jgi:hypothetical protein
LDAFFGQLTQMKPARAEQRQEQPQLAVEVAHWVTKMCAASIGGFGHVEQLKAGPGVDLSRTLSGIPSHQVRMPSLSDSFRASGVPE